MSVTLSPALRPARPATAARTTLVLALLAGAAVGVCAGLRAPPVADAELAGLLRAMAVLKLAFVAAATIAAWWRLQAPIAGGRLLAYAACTVAMGAGPGLIWFSSHVALASALLHGGLVTLALLLWRDPAAADLLRASVLARRAARRSDAAGP